MVFLTKFGQFKKVELLPKVQELIHRLFNIPAKLKGKTHFFPISLGRPSVSARVSHKSNARRRGTRGHTSLPQFRLDRLCTY